MIRVLLSALLFCVTTTALADFEKARNAYLREDYATALKEFRMEAMQGNPEAQSILGLMYTEGQGVNFCLFRAVRNRPLLHTAPSG